MNGKNGRLNSGLTVLVAFGLVGAGSAQSPSSLQPPATSQATTPHSHALGLPELIRLTLEQNPRLAQAAYAVDAARGRAVQAGMYPNPTVSVNLDELGDRTGPGGINTLPLVSQEIVTAGKLKLSRAAGGRAVDQATFALTAERYNRFTAVRQSYFELLTLQRRITILRQLVKLAEESIERTKSLLEGKLVARLDLVQLEVELERLRAELEATQRETPAAFRRLAAIVGMQSLPYAEIGGSLDLLFPDYDLENARLAVVATHPDIQSARAGVERAQLLLRRAQAEPYPNVTVGAGYVRQNQNRSDDWVIGASIPVPLWNRNQGNIAAAHAEVGEALQLVGRVENELVERLAEAFRGYAASRERAERYRGSILPRARETYKLSLEAYQGGQFQYLRVLEAQRAVAQADLEFNRALGEVWKSAAEIAGLLLEDEWPVMPAGEPQP
jgi:cobalt-zinc-cadmium efflux system outer membrane protein